MNQPISIISSRTEPSDYTDWATRAILKLSLCLIKHHDMKTYGGVEV
jgi:hypothetical protein